MSAPSVGKKSPLIDPLRRVKWKVLLLCVALGGVFLFMRYVASPSFHEGMQMLFGDLRSWNWCPAGTVKITFEGASPETRTDAESIRSLCLISFQPVNADIVNTAHFIRLMTAEAAQGQTSVIEGDLSQQVFRADGLPFRSPTLEKAWAGRTSP